MTDRTVSLLFLFVGALVVGGVLLAMVVAIVDGTPLSGPWLAPLIALVCQVAALHLGRRYILPHPVADAPFRAGLIIAARVTVTLAVSVAVVWLMRWVLQWVSDRSLGALTIMLWFALLWWAFRQLNRHSAVSSSARL
jgi:hypothetical protein